MKRILLLLTSLLTLNFSQTSCASINNYNHNYDGHIYYEEFSEYYGIPGHFQMELYTWKIDGEWFSALTYGTNLYKTVDFVKSLQENPCPIYKMKKILQYYPGYERQNVFLFIVSVPPTDSELVRDNKCRERCIQRILNI